MNIKFPLILDGATGTELQKRGYKGDVSAEQWVLDNPESIVEIQKNYVAAGSNVLYSPSFGANRRKLEEHGIFNKTADYNRRLAALSQKAANGKAFVAGDISPTGLFLSPLGEASFEELVDIYIEQAAGLEAAGVDIFVIETMMTLSDARAAVLAVRSVSEKPIMVTFTCDGDGRHALTALEVAVRSTPPSPDGVTHLTLDVIQECVQRRVVQYDKKEDGHYDTISAFIKSIRGSDPDAALYWLAKMLVAGEDPRFIARRLVISASEDIGNADPRGLTVAVGALQAVEFVGMPEARIALAQATTYLATAPKSNRSYEALEKAMHDVETGAVQPVPEHLKNVHVKAIGAEQNDGYKYPHAYKDAWVKQAYLRIPETYYIPSDQGYEATIAKRMEMLKGAF